MVVLLLIIAKSLVRPLVADAIDAGLSSTKRARVNASDARERPGALAAASANSRGWAGLEAIQMEPDANGATWTYPRGVAVRRGSHPIASPDEAHNGRIHIDLWGTNLYPPAMAIHGEGSVNKSGSQPFSGGARASSFPANAATPLDIAIETAIGSLAGSSKHDPASYIDNFQRSAVDKATEVIELLKNSEPPFGEQTPVFLSIGGGDGTEAEHLLRNTSANAAVLLEFAPELADRARQRAQSLPSGKLLRVIEGDAKIRLREATQVAREFVKQGKGAFLAATCHAVIHELADRGSGSFEPGRFFSDIVGDEETPTWLTYREPGAPSKWPQEVILQAACKPRSLLRLADLIGKRHSALGALRPSAYVMGDGICLHSRLAMEVLCKLFYLDDLTHEIEERSTSVDHAQLQNYLWLAIGDEARRDQRGQIRTVSAPTESFARLWRQHSVSVRGMGPDGSSHQLSIAESQTRVVAWRMAPKQESTSTVSDPFEPSSRIPFDVDASAPAIQVAADAFRRNDDQLLSALLASYGRAWVETEAVSDLRSLCEAICASRGPRAQTYLLAHYLYSIDSLFSNRSPAAEMFSEDYERDAEAVGLQDLFRAERMEFHRRLGNVSAAVSTANGLLPRLAEAPHRSGIVLVDYAMGTSHFLLGNLLCHGGLYAQALHHIRIAQSFFKPGIPSHDTESAHCYYASGICSLMTGASTYGAARLDEPPYTQRIAQGLVLLSYSYAAWRVDEADRALDYASKAHDTFVAAKANTYAARAEELRALLEIWYGSGVFDSPMATVDASLARLVRVFAGASTDFQHVARVLPTLRPSRMVGLLQLARTKNPKLWADVKPWTDRSTLTLPPTLRESGPVLAWREPEQVSSLADMDSRLRQHMGIPSDLRVPLISD